MAFVDKFKDLPVSFSHARRILGFLFTGSMFNGPRKFKAGLSTNDKCQHCFQRATHLDIFRDCPHMSKPEIDVQVPDTSWATGIIFEDDLVLDRRKALFSQSDVVSTGSACLLKKNQDAFVDGSCFYSKCRRFSRAAVGIYSPEAGTFSFPMPGADHSSQRSEIYALAAALRMFSGSIRIFSDCATAVKGFQLLQEHDFDLSILKGWDNLDVWDTVCKAEFRRLGSVAVFKVTAHGRDKRQDPYLSQGNQIADEAANSCASTLFQSHFDDLSSKLGWVLDLQIHLIHQFCRHISNDILQEYETDCDFPSSGVTRDRPILNCSCAPRRRIRKKSQVLNLCTGSCQRVLQIVTVERAFLNLLDRKAEIPNSMWNLHAERYPNFHRWISMSCEPHLPGDVSHVVPPRSRKLPNVLKSAILSSIRDSTWGKAVFPSEYTPWAFFMIDVISTGGFLPGYFDQGHSFGFMIERFKCHCKHFIHKAFSLCEDYNRDRHGACFGLSTLSAFSIKLTPRNPKALWSNLVQASIFCN